MSMHSHEKKQNNTVQKHLDTTGEQRGLCILKKTALNSKEKKSKGLGSRDAKLRDGVLHLDAEEELE